MAVPSYVLDDIQAGKEYLSEMNQDLREDFLRGCACKPENQKILERVLIALDGKVELDEFDNSTEANLNILYSIIGGVVVDRLDQTITFPALPTDKLVGDADFSPNATASSGLPVTYTSSNTSVATIVNGLIHLVGSGTTTITAYQEGNNLYWPATPVDRVLSIGNYIQVRFGFTSYNPFAIVETVDLANSENVTLNANEYTLDFTNAANLNYLIVREFATEPIKNIWINKPVFNEGVLPDSKMREGVVIGAYRYYVSRTPFALDSEIYTLTLKNS